MTNNKELTIEGEIDICNTNLLNIYGNFNVKQKLILAKTIAEIHNTKVKSINVLIRNNLKNGYFKNGIDYLDLKNDGFEKFLKNNKLFSQNAINRSKNIFILTEQGYLKLSKLMEDKLISKIILKEYFGVKDERIVIADRYENSFKNFITSILSEYITIKTQFPILNYKVDFFIPELKLIIEYDEHNHKYQLEKDKIRENNIQKEFERWEEDEYTPVKFIRVKQDYELEGIKEIMKEVSKHITSVINFDRLNNEKLYENANNLYDYYSECYTKEYCDSKNNK